MESESLNIVDKFNHSDLPIIYTALTENNSNAKRIIRHSIVDLSVNKIYQLEFPPDYNGKVEDQIIISSEIWNKKNHDNDIAIGNGAYILWKDWDWKNETIEYIDALLGDVEIIFDKLELACYRGCCGIDAFVFTPEEIKKAGNKSESNLQEKIDQIISTLNSTESVVIGMKNLNINIAKSVFIRLLHHIRNCL